MNNNLPTQGSLAPDEVDLAEVFVSFVNFFRKHGTIIVVSCLIGLALSGVYFKLKSNVYSSKLVAECMSLPDGRVVDLLLVLEKLREDEDWKQLGKILNITPKEAKLIKLIEPISSITVDKLAKGIDDYLLPTQATSFLFSVEVLVKDNSILPKLQKGLVSYLSSNEYSSIRVNRFIENRTKMIEYLENEMKKLDSMNLLFANKVVHSTSNESSLTSPGDYKAILVGMQEKKQSFLDELRFATPVRVIQSFTPYSEPVAPILPLVLLIGFLSGFGCSLFIILVLELGNLYAKKTKQKA